MHKMALSTLLRRSCISAIGLQICMVAGCAELDKQQMAMRGEYNANVGLFAEAALAYGRTADQMAVQKHDLQRMLIQRADTDWIEKHTKDGMVVASPSEMAAWVAQRDAATTMLAESRNRWSGVTANFATIVGEFKHLSDVVYAKELDAQAAKESLTKAGRGVIDLITGAAGAAAVAIPLAF